MPSGSRSPPRKAWGLSSVAGALLQRLWAQHWRVILLRTLLVNSHWCCMLVLGQRGAQRLLNIICTPDSAGERRQVARGLQEGGHHGRGGVGEEGVRSTRPSKAPLNLGTRGREHGCPRSPQAPAKTSPGGPAGGSSLKPHVACATPASPGPSRETARSRVERTGTMETPLSSRPWAQGLPTVCVRMWQRLQRNHRGSKMLQ